MFTQVKIVLVKCVVVISIAAHSSGKLALPPISIPQHVAPPLRDSEEFKKSPPAPDF